jgi:hypothetical protein
MLTEMSRKYAAFLVLAVLILAGCGKSEVDRLRQSLQDDAIEIDVRAADVQAMQSRLWQMEHGPAIESNQAEYDALMARYRAERDTLLGIMVRYNRDLAELQRLDPSVHIESTKIYNLDKEAASPLLPQQVDIRDPRKEPPEEVFAGNFKVIFWPGLRSVEILGLSPESSTGTVVAVVFVTLAAWFVVLLIVVRTTLRVRTALSERRMWSEFRRTGKLPQA